MFNKIPNVADKLIHAAKVIGEPTIGAAMKQQQTIDTFSAKAGSEPLGKAIYHRITKQALALGQDVDASLSGTMSFMSNTIDPSKLEQLNGLAMRLSMLNPTEGLEGAASSMKELMSGNYTSMADRFNMSGAMLEGSEVQQAGLKGNIDEFIKGMDELLNQQNMTQEAFEKLLDRPLVKWQKIIQIFKYSMANAGEDAANALSPLLDMIIKGFESDEFRLFLNIVSVGLTGLVAGIQWVVTMVQNAWPAILQIFLGIGTLIYNLGVILLGLMPIILGVAAAWLVLNFVVKKNPIGLFISSVIGLITVLVSLGLVTNGIRQVFSDAFGFIVDVVEDAINAVFGIINGAIKGINAVSGFFANLLNVESKQIQEIQVKADFSEFKKAGQNAIENFSIDDLKAKFGLDNKFNKQEDYPLNNPLEDSFPNIDRIDRVGEVGKINDTVDISSEDLKIMRELAEMKNIQNFVTLTPTVSVTTGDIRNGSDADTIVSKIKTMLERDIASSTSAVYG
ncbi:hypothetical protein [Desulfitobacterium dehalogenans]|nr:hypothetical protein [Desulfitobacterium dehalogenans]